MKLKYLLAPLAVAFAFLFTACDDNDYDPDVLSNLKVSNSYLSFSGEEAETQTITVNATEDWYFITDEDELSIFGVDTIPSWLSVNPLLGSAGETTVTFSATEYSGTGSALFGLRVGNTTQYINVAIGAEGEVEEVSISYILNQGQDGTTYKVSGYCTLIINTNYGNWYMSDDEGNSLLIYGTVNSGGSYDWDGIGIELGDYVTVQGPRTTYGGTTIELVDVSVISIVKNLISVETEAEEIAKEGGEASVVLSVSGSGLTVSIPDEDKSWLSMTGMDFDGSEATVTFCATENDGATRSTTVTFSTISNGTTYSTEATITQAGSIVDATAAEINAAEDGGTYRITGYISSMDNTTYGNYYITDYTGTVYVYGTLDADGNSKNWSSLGINEGDIITVYGEKASYNGSPQMKNVSVESFYSVTDKTVAEFLACEESDDVYYRISGTITNIASTTYGNLTIEDETGSVLIYGLLKGYGAASKSYADIADQIAVGDVITAVGHRDSYGTTDEMTSGFLVKHVAAATE